MREALKDVPRFLVSPVALPVALVVAFCWPVWFQLFTRWSVPDDPYSHGWLIGAISIVQLFLISRQLDYSQRQSGYAGLVPLFATAMLSHLLNMVNVQTVQLALLPLVLLSALYSTLGWSLTKRLSFSILFLYFALPVWSPVVPVLQGITTQINGFFLSLWGISFAIDGVLITTPVGMFEVADGCSGLKYFLTSLSLSSLYAYWFLDRTKSRVMLVLAAIGLAMLTNWIRVFVIVMAGYLSAMKHPLVTDHDNFGWVLYGVSLIPFYWLAHRLSVPAAAPVSVRYTSPYPQVLMTLGIQLLILAGVLGWAMGTKATASYEMPVWRTESQAPQIELQPSWRPVIHGRSAEKITAYNGNGTESPLWLLSYDFAVPWIYEIRDYRDNYFPTPWNVEDMDTGTVAGIGQVQIASISRHGGKSRHAVLYWYTVGDQTTVSARTATMLQARDLMRGQYGANLTFLAKRCDGNCNNARKRLEEFADNMVLSAN